MCIIHKWLDLGLNWRACTKCGKIQGYDNPYGGDAYFHYTKTLADLEMHRSKLISHEYDLKTKLDGYRGVSSPEQYVHTIKRLVEKWKEAKVCLLRVNRILELEW